MSFTTYTVGRSKDADIRYDDPGISRRHVEITRTDDGRLYLVDANSTGGTFVWRNNEWVVIKQGFIARGDRLSLGKMQVAASELYDRVAGMQPRSSAQWEPVSIRPRRSALTGEVKLN